MRPPPLFASVVLAALLPAFPLVTARAAPDARLEEARSILRTGGAEEFARAESLGRACLKDAESLEGSEGVGVADAIDVILRSLWLQRKTKDPEGRVLGERAAAIRERHAAQDPAALGRTLYQYATWLRVGGDYAAALPLYMRALEVQEKALGPGHADVSSTCNGLATLHHRAGRLEEARRVYEKALAIQKELVGPDHADYALVLGNLANVLRDLDDLDGARRLKEEALAITERRYGSDSPELIADVAGLGIVLTRSGEYEAARDAFSRELRLAEAEFGAQSQQAGAAAAHLASITLSLGDLRAARVYAERAVRNGELTMRAGDPNLGSAYDNLGLTLEALGDFDGARDAVQHALGIWSVSPGPRTPRVAEAHRALGRLETKRGDLVLAERHLETALEILEESLGSGASIVAGPLVELAALHLAAGRVEPAFAAAERAVAVRTSALGSDHPLTIEADVQLARAWDARGDLRRARDRAGETLLRAQNTLGAEHPTSIAIAVLLARFESKAGDTQSAFERALQSEAAGRDHVRATARVLAESEALRFDAVRASGLSIALSSLAREAPPDRVRRAWDSIVRSRALVLDEIAARHRLVVESTDEETIRLAKELTAARTHLSREIVRENDEKDPARRLERLRAARRERDRAESALATHSAAFRAERDARDIGADAVLAALPTDATLVSFVAYEDERLGPRYGAFLGRGGQTPAAEFLVLGGRAEIDSAASRWNRAVRASARATPERERAAALEARALGAPLRELVWTPIAARLGPLRRLYLVPDAALHQVNFGALPLGAEDFVFDRVSVLHYATTERDLVERPRLETQGKAGALLVGAPHFDSTRPFASLAGAAARPAPARAGTIPLRAGLADCDDFAELRFGPLQGASREVREVEKTWKRATGGGGFFSSSRGATLRLEGDAATEKRVKEEAGRRGVLHFATHGFVLGGDCVPGRAALASGLAFAGANHRDAAGPGEEDGVLTAEEIASLDLSRAGWAVLSACETGAGEATASEGVLGLRRAFQVAGVRTVFLTLWPVDDEAARDWIGALYTGRFERGLPTDEAASEASRATLAALRAGGAIPHPFLWANFIAAGDWR